MERLEALHQETVLLLRELQGSDKENTDRNQVIEKVQAHIARRDELLAEIKEPYTNEEMKIGKQIVILNEEIKKRMNHLFQEIKKDMKQVRQRKEQNYSYINPYGKVSTMDGLYMDRKS